MANAYGVNVSQNQQSNCLSTNLSSGDEFLGQAMSQGITNIAMEATNKSFTQLTHACKNDVPLAGQIDRKMNKVALGDKFISLSKIYNHPSQGSGAHMLGSDDRLKLRYHDSQPYTLGKAQNSCFMSAEFSRPKTREQQRQDPSIMTQPRNRKQY